MKKKSVLFVPSVGNSGTFLQAACITSNQQSENVTQNGFWVLITIKEMDLASSPVTWQRRVWLCERNLQDPDKRFSVFESWKKTEDMEMKKKAVTGLNAGGDAERTDTKSLFTNIL